MLYGERLWPRLASLISSCALVLSILSITSTTISAQTVITSVLQLDEIGVLPSMPLSGTYILGANIDGLNFNFTPIGSASNPFTGAFEGNGFTIDNLHVSSSGIYVGMFGQIGLRGQVSDVRLTNESVMGSLGYDVGGLAGRNQGTITNAFVTGSINGTAGNVNLTQQGIAVGGITGWNFGTIDAAISRAFVTSPTTSTTGVGVDLGGISGGNTGLVINSTAASTVTGTSGAYATGLLSIGGLVGELGFSDGTSGRIINSSATGTVSGLGNNTAAGGLVG